MRKFPRRRHSRSGAILVLMAFLLFVFIGFAALAVDISYLYTIRTQLQITATSSAAAGALVLPDESAAAATAADFAEKNMPPGVHGQVLAASDVQFGHWDFHARTLTLGGTPVNAVQVTVRRSAANSNPAGSVFSRLFGIFEYNVSTIAAAAKLPDLLGLMSATESVRVSGNVSADSYHSGDGPYNPATAGNNGDILSSGPVTVTGSAVVKGDVRGETISESVRKRFCLNYSAKRRSENSPYRRFRRKT